MDYEQEPLEIRVKYMDDDELLSRYAHCWHRVEQCREHADYDAAEKTMHDYAIFREELMRRLTYHGSFKLVRENRED